MSEKLHTIIVSAFPCTGKTTFHNLSKLETLDSDSSKFDKKDFPNNYIEHIKENIGKVDVIFVSSHEEVRKALCENNLFFVLVYPKLELRSEYYSRMVVRKDNAEFVNFIDSNWVKFTNQMHYQTNCVRCELERGQYISDVIWGAK